MRIGLSFDLKEKVSTAESNLPDDAFEEYDYPSTVDFIAKSIEASGHSVLKLGGGRDFLNNILLEKVDIVFNISEGRGTFRSREAQVPSVLEMLNIPYTGSDPECLALCLDKPLTKQLLAAAGIATPPWKVIKTLNELDIMSWQDISFPVIVKPAFEGSSKGVRLNSVVHDVGQLVDTVRQVLEMYRQPAMIEGFVSGDEVTVGVLGNPPEVIGIMRILPRKKTDYFVYSLEVKRDWKLLVDYECPAGYTKAILDNISESSLKAFNTLECRDFARVDFRMGSDGTPYFIEINPLPGLGDYSDLVIMGIKMGWSHEGLVQTVLNTAVERYPICVQK